MPKDVVKMLLKDKHEFICGATQSGKSYYAEEKGRKWKKGGVIFFNPQDMDLKGYVKATMKNDLLQIIKMLNQGEKINYIPRFTKEVAEKEIKYISQVLLQYHVKKKIKGKTLFIVDECQIYARSNSNNPIEDVATRGLGKGLIGTFITQRPALVSNTLFTQSEIKTFFRLEKEEWAYFKNYDMVGIQNKIIDAGDHNYIIKHNHENIGPMKL